MNPRKIQIALGRISKAVPRSKTHQRVFKTKKKQKKTKNCTETSRCTLLFYGKTSKKTNKICTKRKTLKWPTAATRPSATKTRTLTTEHDVTWNNILLYISYSTRPSRGVKKNTTTQAPVCKFCLRVVNRV